VEVILHSATIGQHSSNIRQNGTKREEKTKNGGVHMELCFSESSSVLY